jgi:hypothetical protein
MLYTTKHLLFFQIARGISHLIQMICMLCAYVGTACEMDGEV